MGFLSRLFGERPPPIRAHIAFDGAIRVLESPTAPGWQHTEDQRRGEGFSVMVLRYVLPLSPLPLALLAKRYTSDDGTAPPPPAETDWRATFQPLFSDLTKVEHAPATQLTMHSSANGVEARLEGLGAHPPVPLRIRERRAVLANEQFIVTAMGSPEASRRTRRRSISGFQQSLSLPDEPAARI